MRTPTQTVALTVTVAALTLADAADNSRPVVRPVGELPAGVPWSAGELTLYADFRTKLLKGVPVYLTNRTGENLRLPASSGRPVIVREYESAPGVWTRAEPFEYAAWRPAIWINGRRATVCGLTSMQWQSDNVSDLPDRHFATLSLPRGGGNQPANVRFTLALGAARVSSNAGPGVIDPAAVKVAETDSLAVHQGDFAFVRRIATGEAWPAGERPVVSHARVQAVLRLARDPGFDRRETEKVLRVVALDPDPVVSREAAVALNDLGPQ